MKWRHKNQSQIFDSIQRLWHYIQSVLVMDTKNWRLVIGRVARLVMESSKPERKIAVIRPASSSDERVGPGLLINEMTGEFKEVPSMLLVNSSTNKVSCGMNFRVLKSSVSWPAKLQEFEVVRLSKSCMVGCQRFE
uniref:Uncharacterized protein n=1 Tax=Ditylenchus dipsaci TaxID=166011 RepID=A0A915DG85_9BILA